MRVLDPCCGSHMILQGAPDRAPMQLQEAHDDRNL
jgi:hypothetical protein